MWASESSCPVDGMPHLRNPPSSSLQYQRCSPLRNHSPWGENHRSSLGRPKTRERERECKGRSVGCFPYVLAFFAFPTPSWLTRVTLARSWSLQVQLLKHGVHRAKQFTTVYLTYNSTYFFQSQTPTQIPKNWKFYSGENVCIYESLSKFV